MAYKPAYIWNGTSFDQIGNQAVASLDSYVLLAGQQVVSDKIITSASVVSPTISTPIINTPTINGGTADSLYFISPSEKITISSASATGIINFNFIDQGILYYTGNSASNFSVNFRGNATTTLNTIMSTGESLSGILIVTNGTTAYYGTSFSIDGSSITPRWAAGSAPTSGNTSSLDVYSFTIIKTANATFTMLASTGKFA